VPFGLLAHRRDFRLGSNATEPTRGKIQQCRVWSESDRPGGSGAGGAYKPQSLGARVEKPIVAAARPIYRAANAGTPFARMVPRVAGLCCLFIDAGGGLFRQALR
jgi:hypothetical protein